MEILVRNLRLISTISAILLLGVSAVSAQSAKTDEIPAKAPAAQQNAPAEKVAGRMMNAATGASITLNQMFEILAELTGYKGKPAYEAERAGDIRDSLADISLPFTLAA